MYKKYYDAGRSRKLGGHLGGFFELIIEMIYSKILREGDFSIDCGVNYGEHTFPMHNVVGSTGIVLGFEALTNLTDLINSKILSKNIDNIKIVNKAIGSSIGVTDFTYVPDANGYSGIKQNIDIPEHISKNIVNLLVPLTTIDHEVSLLNTSKTIRFIKLDLEGGEYDALIGASIMMRDHSPLIVFENSRNSSLMLYGYTIESWFTLFENYGYKLYDLFGRDFSRDNWDQDDIPWYFIAAKRDIDILFVKNNLIDCIEEIYKKHFERRWKDL